MPQEPPDPDEMPELARLRQFDREEHVRRSIAAGLTPEQAEKHADDDLADRDDAVP